MASTPLWLLSASLLILGGDAVHQLPAVQVAEGTSWLRPDTVLRPPGGLPLVLKTSPTAGITTIRAFVPLDESFAEAGSGRVLAQVAAGRVRGAAARVGATFVALRTPSGIA